MAMTTAKVTAHDAVFKTFMCHTDTARDFLEFNLPVSLRQLCDLDSLKLESGSFIEENLRAYYSDVLWSLKTAEGEGFIYVVIEHQSSPDAHMAFRLMRYAMGAMQRHLDAGHKKLPLVIPMLFYHGAVTPYPFSLCWLDEFADPSTARQLYTAAFPLVDITVVADDDIMQHRRIALLELMQKHIRKRDLMGLMEQLVALLIKGYANDSQLKTLFNYMMQTGDAAHFSEFLAEVAQRSPHHKERLMTIADRLRQQGLDQGIQQGKRDEAQRIARMMLADGIDAHTVARITGLPVDELTATRA